MENMIAIKIAINNESLSSDLLKKFDFLSLSFQKMRYHEYRKRDINAKFSQKRFDELLNTLINIDKKADLEADTFMGHQMGIIRRESNSFFHITLDIDTFYKNKAELLDTMNEIFDKNNAVVGYMATTDDRFWQNVEQIDWYKALNKSYDGLKLIPSTHFKNEMIVDIEQNPGHDHIVNELWFGSFWAMWFGAEYYNYISEKAIAGFKDGFENIQLKNGARRILLYEDILSFEDPEHRKVQQKFKDVTGMDEIAHQLMKKPKGNLDPTLEILDGTFEHSGTRLIKRYLDTEDMLIEKSKAAKCEEYEYTVDEKKVWHIVWTGTNKI